MSDLIETLESIFTIFIPLIIVNVLLISPLFKRMDLPLYVASLNFLWPWAMRIGFEWPFKLFTCQGSKSGASRAVLVLLDSFRPMSLIKDMVFGNIPTTFEHYLSPASIMEVEEFHKPAPSSFYRCLAAFELLWKI